MLAISAWQNIHPTCTEKRKSERRETEERKK
jgi:hypothetical protein